MQYIIIQYIIANKLYKKFTLSFYNNEYQRNIYYHLNCRFDNFNDKQRILFIIKIKFKINSYLNNICDKLEKYRLFRFFNNNQTKPSIYDNFTTI